MKNILNEKPSDENLHGRFLESIRFVEDKDIQNKEILDIGCGFGWCELNFLKRKARKVYGIEVTKEDLKTAKKHITDSRVEFTVAGATDLPFKNKFFDTVVSWEVIEHIPKNTENVMFAEVNRVLKKNGVFYLSTPYNHVISNTFDPAWWLIGHRHYSKKFLTKRGTDNGFEIEEIRIKGKFFQAYAWVNLYLSKWVFRRNVIFREGLDKKIDEEYLDAEGYANIFVKYRKIEDISSGKNQ